MKISLKQKKLKSEKYTLYLEFYKGSKIDKSGKEIHLREFEYLKLHLFINPKTFEERKKNKENLELAENILAIRKSEYIQGKYGIIDRDKANITFYEYFDRLKEHRSSYLSNYGTWASVKRYIDQYFHPSTTLSEITIESIKGFKRFLDKEALTKNGTPLKHGTKYSYFNRFKATIKQAYEEGYISNHKLLKIKSFEEKDSQREFLTFDEVQALANTDCKYNVLKRAFLFSCLTGLRWSDIYKLSWNEVRDENDNYRIFFKQQKTDDLEYMYISKQARDLLGNRDHSNPRVFVNLNYGSGTNTELLRWCMKAGITKHITFHCARHTAATLQLEYGADIYTVMKFLGHKDIRTTQIYAHIMDNKMKETANLLPSLNLEL
ncbi:site-specific integrase [Empedobacter falsenii]|uniref:Tyrosine recombinase XerD n=1 Tax=Empedobacter falsenii TaxID=343874 RepID=A0A376G900_9FLAO|nr:MULTISPECIES: site-specific integrase [Empedobacter]MDM1043155.1 site-specific integrase [Empedobacter brevis]MDM1137083.1 site-specific integrase [Empedobacter sp. R750]STD55962.1 Tyrosine recombinase XerD [Empedobacter falsenii]